MNVKLTLAKTIVILAITLPVWAESRMPHLSIMQTRYEDEGLVVVDVSIDEPDVVKASIDEDRSRMEYTVAADRDLTTPTTTWSLSARMASLTSLSWRSPGPRFGTATPPIPHWNNSLLNYSKMPSIRSPRPNRIPKSPAQNPLQGVNSSFSILLVDASFDSNRFSILKGLRS